MRLCTRASVTASTTATVTAMAIALLAVPGALSVPAYAEVRPPACAAAPGDRTFPVTTRIHGGPAVYEAGGEHRTWRLDLTNTTARPCTGIHPVLVLVDERRALTTAQPRLEFYDGSRPRPYPVTFEATDADETIGVFDGDGFAGFTVGPGRTVSVKVRLAIGADAVANDVVANAAVVQRHADDGDWVGQSDDYRFRVVAPADPADPADPAAEAVPGEPTTGVQDGLPYAADEFAGELAGTGRRRTTFLAGIALALLLTGGGLRVLGAALRT
ncbi:hypothetical protein ACH4TV_06865 [Streptomyces sp. NPDC020898]|uniref:hypothetical protein n=1 Tax=Streptomyces sp. NPDC020898 TaxID=3365101 RepID=UPI003787CFDC